MLITKEEKLNRVYKKLKIGIWLYFLLLIFEGALRKWFLPFLSTPLLVVRDPIALWLIYITWKYKIFPSNFYILIMSITAAVSICAALVFGHGNLGVALYGARILILHFPVMFIIGKIFNNYDVVKLGKVLLWIAIPMVILIGLQFYSPPSAWVNKGVGGIGTAGFSGANGYQRPPGTFSFTTGNVLFFSFTACFVFYFWVSKIKINRLLLIAATLALLASISFSISRTLFYSIGVTIIFTIASVSRQPKYVYKIVGAVVIMGALLAVLSQTEFFQTGTAAFTARFNAANETEGGVTNSLYDRFFGKMFGAVERSGKHEFFGQGIGMGTNVGSNLLTGKSSFLIAESEWSRIVGEMGFLLGILVILVRLVFCVAITMKSFKALKAENFLPWILLSFGLIVISQGQWAQPTVLGFSTIAGGIILAALKKRAREPHETLS